MVISLDVEIEEAYIILMLLRNTNRYTYSKKEEIMIERMIKILTEVLNK